MRILKPFTYPPKYPWSIPSNIQPIIDKSCVLNLLPVRNNNKWLDYSAYKNHGTIIGASWKTMPTGAGLYFDGDDDYVNCGNDPSLEIPIDRTEELWIYPRAFGSNDVLIRNTASHTYLMMYMGDGRITYHIYGTNSCIDARSSNTAKGKMVLNQWNHVAVTYDGEYIRFYLNGQFDTQHSCSAISLITGAGVEIGGQASIARWTNGTIDEVRIYNRALSPDEIKRLFEWSKSRHL